MPTEYVYFTDEQKEHAHRTDLADLLRRQGEKLKRSGSEYEWRDGSAKVTSIAAYINALNKIVYEEA